jgi:UDP-N-acetylmuramyl tripeptide synthase
MSLRTKTALVIGNFVSRATRFFKLGSGITWAGEIALRIDPSFISAIKKELSTIIVVAGTNGKTTTASMIEHVLNKNNIQTIHNSTGANLKNGIVGTFITQQHNSLISNKCVGIFEVDEAELPNIVPLLCPDILLLLNLFRDQLDRYGEVNSIADKWRLAITDWILKNNNGMIQKHTLLINADDPLISSIGTDIPITVKTFGLSKQKTNKVEMAKDTWGDSYFCLRCGTRLVYKTIYFSHLGDWYCPHCGIKHLHTDMKGGSIPITLKGLYNQYNATAALLAVCELGLPVSETDLKDFKPVFGRQEEFIVNGKKIKMFLSKNPTGCNEGIRTIASQKDVGCILFSLNDRIPDGTDVSWIWDVDVSPLISLKVPIICTGDRVWDMALRLKYESIRNTPTVIVEKNYKIALATALDKTKKNKTLYLLPTYSAMLDIRKELTGRKIA